MQLAPGAAQMGPTAVKNPDALMAAIRQQQPPNNSRTPMERLNPDKEALEFMKGASVSLERAAEHTNDTHMVMALNAMAGVLNKALLRFDGQSVLQALQEACGTFPPAVGPAPGAGAPPQPAPAPGMGSAAGPPQAAPQQPPQGGGPPAGLLP